MQFDLVLRCNTSSRPQSLFLLYDSGKFTRQYASVIAETTRHVLHQLSLGSTQRLRDIVCLSANSKTNILKWNPTLPKGLPTCVHQMVTSKSKEVPDREAVCAWDGSLTYAQLDQFSSNLAARLVTAGVEVGHYIPFAFEKSMWAVVAALAILKAGGAFVPLDPSHPKARLVEILKSTDAKLVVTSNSLVHLFNGLDKRVVSVSIEAIDSTLERNVVLPFVRPSDPVFALFTSGSTGQPKGMVHTHGAICMYFRTHGDLMGYHNSRVFQFSAYTFDAAILDIFTTLLFGGCVCVPSEEDRISNITGVINKMKVDFALLTPSFASLMTPKDVPSLRTLCVAGESLSQGVIDRWVGEVRLMNAYGPAEVGICFLKDVDRDTRPETIGYPLLNCSCWLVNPDDQDRLVPVGAVGELVVAGPSLAKEYLNDEARTKSSFITGLAWAGSVGLKDRTFFKTGDLLRYNVNTMDGSCDFVRRKDNQIKLHGQRIEAGDVECRLVKLPGVAVAVVVQPKLGCFAGELVAVLQMSRSKAPRLSNKAVSLDTRSRMDQKMVRWHLEKHLPTYMVPMTYLVIVSVPVNQSGKTDRKAILTWVSSFETRPFIASASYQSESKLSPLGTHEKIAHTLSQKVAELVAIKDEVRGLMLLGHDFNLLEAGVNSIQMIQLLMFLRTFGIHCPVNKLWSSRTRLRDLAYMIEYGSSDVDSAASDDVYCLSEYHIYEQGILKDLKPCEPISQDVPVKNILLTGASGFLGLRILQNLLTRSSCHVFALFRCRSPSEGLSRLIDNAIRQCWWSPSYVHRLHVWPCDITKPDFSLTQPNLDTLYGLNLAGGPTIHAIVHNAAQIHYNLTFDALIASNIIPTISFLQIAARVPNISNFVYISGGTNPSFEETSLAEQAQRADCTNGYGQTKFVAEALVRRCMNHAAFAVKWVSVAKPGYIISGVDGDEPNKDDFLWRLIAACLEMKSFNQSEAQKWLFVSDVDYVAGQVSDLAIPSGQRNVNLNILQGMMFEELWELLRKDFGYHLEGLPEDKWRWKLESSIIEKGEGHVMFPFAHKLRASTLSIGEEIRNEEHADFEHVKEAMRWNVRRLVEVGFFPPPALSC